MLNGSSDAKLIVPLFNALNLAHHGVDFTYELCADVPSALAYLHIPPEEGREIIAQTT